jgi:hypothetical protein
VETPSLRMGIGKLGTPHVISAPLARQSTVRIGTIQELCCSKSPNFRIPKAYMIGSYVVWQNIVCRNSVVESRLILKILRRMIGPFFYAVDTLLSEDLLFMLSSR